jgi:hypothetical protein
MVGRVRKWALGHLLRGTTRRTVQVKLYLEGALVFPSLQVVLEPLQPLLVLIEVKSLLVEVYREREAWC